MNYRSIADMNLTIGKNLSILPPVIDVVVGIPRSGLLAALMISLIRNLPVVDVDGLLEGRLFPGGQTTISSESTAQQFDRDPESILLVDDSHHTGISMSKAVEKISAQFPNTTIHKIGRAHV